MPSPTAEAPLPRLHNPNLTDDEVRLLAHLIDLHRAKCVDTLSLGDILIATQQIFLTMERGGGMELVDKLKAKFDKLYELVGCNCGDPNCSQARLR